jgi:hypothetical protein
MVAASLLLPTATVGRLFGRGQVGPATDDRRQPRLRLVAYVGGPVRSVQQAKQLFPDPLLAGHAGPDASPTKSHLPREPGTA